MARPPPVRPVDLEKMEEVLAAAGYSKGAAGTWQFTPEAAASAAVNAGAAALSAGLAAASAALA